MAVALHLAVALRLLAIALPLLALALALMGFALLFRQLKTHCKALEHDMRGRAKAACLLAATRVSVESDEEEDEEAPSEDKQEAPSEDELVLEEESSEAEDEDDATEQVCKVVGIRLRDGLMQRFMFWVGHKTNECTYEANQNTVEYTDILTQVLRFEFTDDREPKYALVKKHLSGSEFAMEYQGRSARKMSAKEKKFVFDLSGWCEQSANVGISGWAISTYTEWEQAKY